MDNLVMDILTNIAANLNQWMADHPTLTTLKKVSSRSGVGFGTVQRCRNGNGNPTITHLADIAKAFGQPLEALLKPPIETKAEVVVQDSASSAYALPPRPVRPLVREITALAERINDDGLLKATGYLEGLAGSHPIAKAKAASFQ